MTSSLRALFRCLAGWDATGYNIGNFDALFLRKSNRLRVTRIACRATPIAGSFVSTRSMRFAISLVPSATVTCPECCE